jgi:hypothetical protein
MGESDWQVAAIKTGKLRQQLKQEGSEQSNQPFSLVAVRLQPLLAQWQHESNTANVDPASQCGRG